MPASVPQVNVIISFTPDSNVVYSYTTPGGETFTNSPTCNLVITQATNCLFVLDYPSTLAGWTILGIAPNPASDPVLASSLGPGGQSLMTTDSYDNPDHIYNYYINYLNTVTGEPVSHDPQEGNEPP